MASKLTLQSTWPLPNTPVQIPLLGFGVYESHEDVCISSIHTALKAGYRHIDTAQSYGNEAEVGRAIATSGIPRSEIFITSKIRVPAEGLQDHYSSIIASIDKIDPSPNGNVDLFLIHSPKPPAEVRRRVWFALERLLAEGRVKSIGVSNWDVSRIEEMKSWGEREGAIWPPMVNQIEWVALVKSDTPSRIVENSEVYGFALSEEDLGALDGLDRGADGAIVWAVRK